MMDGKTKKQLIAELKEVRRQSAPEKRSDPNVSERKERLETRKTYLRERRDEMTVKVPATDMVAGESGPVIEILGGFGLRDRLGRLGIREGGVVTMVHTPQMGGPVVVTAAGSQVALGFGMATKVVVEVERR